MAEDAETALAANRAEPVLRENPPTLLDMPGHLLRRCHQIAVGIFLEECRPFDLTPLQFVALMTLSERGPLDQTALGRAAALDRTTSAIVIRALTLRGLVVRNRSQQDKRSKIVSLTEDGREMLRVARASADEAQRRIASPLTLREQQQLVRLLGKMALANNDFSRAPQSDS